jgi:hypothetical protein
VLSVDDVNLLDSALDAFLDFLDMNKRFRKSVFSKWWVRLRTHEGFGFEKFSMEPETQQTSLFTTSPFVEADDAGFYKKKKRYKLGTINNAKEELSVPVEIFDSFYIDNSRVSLFYFFLNDINTFINSSFKFLNFLKLEVMPNDFGLIYT